MNERMNEQMNEKKNKKAKKRRESNNKILARENMLASHVSLSLRMERMERMSKV